MIIALVLGLEPVTARTVRVAVYRWLELNQFQGQVTYQPAGQASRPARRGSRLQSVGDRLVTGPKSSAVLAVDTAIGTVNISENTSVRVQEMQVISNGGHITKLQVTGGQVRIKVRKFTNPNSTLEIQTPAGISGVRGTLFGVNVQPDGKTGVATLEGRVLTSAQGKAVSVKAGFQNLMIPGQPPSAAVPLKQDTRLTITELGAVDAQTARIAGQVDPVNLVLFANKPIVLDRMGEFDLQLPLPPNRQVEVTVVTPLGKRQIYQLAIP